MRKLSTRSFVVMGICVALVLAFLVAPHASSSPDGLEKVASDKGIDAGVTDHAISGSPLAHYAVNGVDSNNLSTGLAGIIGVAVTFALAFGLLTIVRRSSSDAPQPQAPPSLTTTSS